MESREELLKKRPKEGYKFIYRYYDEFGSYIGQTKKSLKERAGKEGRAYLQYEGKWPDALLKKGIDHFNVEILEECIEADADSIEKKYITKFDSRENGYNSTYGGKSYNPFGGYRRHKDTDKYVLYYELGLSVEDAILMMSNESNWVRAGTYDDDIFKDYGEPSSNFKCLGFEEGVGVSIDEYRVYPHCEDSKSFLVSRHIGGNGPNSGVWVLPIIRCIG